MPVKMEASCALDMRSTAFSVSSCPLQFEITERETSWSGHIEIGLSAERRRVDDNNISGMSCDSFYFKPANSTSPITLGRCRHIYSRLSRLFPTVIPSESSHTVTRSPWFPAADSGYSRGGTSTPLRPAPPTPLSGDELAPGLRLGVLCANNTITLYTRKASEGYAPRRFGQMDARFASQPYVIINLYGQTRGVRAVNP